MGCGGEAAFARRARFGTDMRFGTLKGFRASRDGLRAAKPPPPDAVRGWIVANRLSGIRRTAL